MSINSLFSRARAFAFALIITGLVTQSPSAATIITEDFSTAPRTRGWEIHNDTSLFVWNSTNQNLEVTWDSSKTNSYFRLPISAISSDSDFSAELDLHLHERAIGTTPGKPSTFQIAFGFQNRASADATGFIRGTGANTPNLAEFNFMPDSGFGPTVWPAMFPTNGLMNYSGATDFGIFEIPVGTPMRVLLNYAATNHTLSLQILTNGITVGEIVRAPLVETNTGFRLDAFSISSYSDEGQFPGEYQGSILAHGTIDNIQITLPSSPIHQSSGSLVEGKWHHHFTGEPGWLYVLEASLDFVTWAEVSAPIEGTGSSTTLTPAIAETSTHRFFRVKATRL